MCLCEHYLRKQCFIFVISNRKSVPLWARGMKNRVMDTGIVGILSKRITAYGKDHEESISQFAQGCGVSESSIRRIENGTSNVRLSLIDKIIAYMGISLAELLADMVKE